MKTGSFLCAVIAVLTLTACGPTAPGQDEVSEADLGQSTAELNTCTNDCAAYGGQGISCTGNTCTAASNYVVCDGSYTYCSQTQPGPCAGFSVQCPYGGTVSCPTGTQVCYERTSCSIVCDGRVRSCWLPAGQQCTA